MLLTRPGPWWVEAAAGRSEPVFSFEGEIEQRGQGGDEGGGGRESPVAGVAGVGQVLAVEAGDRGGTAMIAAQLVTFFMMRFIRLACTVRLVSTVVATRSRRDSVHSVARSTWS